MMKSLTATERSSLHVRWTSPPVSLPPSALGRISAASLSTSDRTCSTSPSFTLSASASSDPASFFLSFFNPFCPALPPPLHFLRPCLSQFPRPLSLSFCFSHSLSLALSLSSFHAALGLPKRLGLNGENLLWYNEMGERQRGGEGREMKGLGGLGRMRGCWTQEGRESWGCESRGTVGCRSMQGCKGDTKSQKLNKWLCLISPQWSVLCWLPVMPPPHLLSTQPSLSNHKKNKTNYTHLKSLKLNFHQKTLKMNLT